MSKISGVYRFSFGQGIAEKSTNQQIKASLVFWLGITSVCTNFRVLKGFGSGLDVATQTEHTQTDTYINRETLYLRK